eukprot:CAMPEP_0168806466 /NCGR_PEP_ID=MMETSP0726-20121227/1559_1 /TAXON_ID=265536 /ORGANISM="Amphiprora sp., Strain CCMP467" /LENGTH=69 /DNA_ID=CAMNT_0008858369 /DNA_START=17 /DNA_END=223 /DNA_ORIENTATION=-
MTRQTSAKKKEDGSSSSAGRKKGERTTRWQDGECFVLSVLRGKEEHGEVRGNLGESVEKLSQTIKRTKT